MSFQKKKKKTPGFGESHTNSIIADPLTNGLPPQVFHEHTTHMSVLSIDDM